MKVKLLLTLGCCVAALTNVQAQHVELHEISKKTDLKSSIQKIRFFKAKQSLKKKGPTYRIIATHSTEKGVFVDSSQLTYPIGIGSNNVPTYSQTQLGTVAVYAGIPMDSVIYWRPSFQNPGQIEIQSTTGYEFGTNGEILSFSADNFGSRTTEVYNYDTNGELQETWGYKWNGSSWDIISHQNYTHSTNYFSMISRRKSTPSSSWDTLSKFEAYLDAQGRNDSTINSTHNNGQFQLNAANKYIYNAAGDVVTQRTFRYDNNNSSFYAYLTLTRDYNSNGVLTHYEQYNEVNAYIQNEIEYFISNGQIDSFIQSGYNQQSQQVDPIYKSVYTYTNGLVQQEYGSIYSNGNWLTNRRWDYSHDVNGNIDSSEFYIYTQGNWSDGLKIRFYYEQYNALGLSTNPKGSLNVYPNPNSNQFHFELPDGGSYEKTQVVIYNLQGELLLQSLQSGNNIVSLDHHLAPGVYLYKLKSGSKQYTGKIIVR